MRYYVAPGATGTGTTWANAGDLQTIVNSIIAAPSAGGDEIWALHGIYSIGSPLVINSNPAPLSIYGGFRGNELTLAQRNANISVNNPNLPNYFRFPSILDGGNSNPVINLQGISDFLIDGFVITQGNAATAAMPNGGGLNVVNSNNIRFENLVIMNNHAVGNGGGMHIQADAVIIKNTLFFSKSTPAGGSGGGLFLDSCDDIVVVNGLFSDNSADGMGGGLFMFNCTNIQLIDNTIANNTAIGFGAGVYCDNSFVRFYNSIISDNVDANPPLPQPNIIAFNCLFSLYNRFNIPNASGLPAGTNPDFANPAPLSVGGDYHLLPTSPCIDAGDSTYGFPFSATDLEGRQRIIGVGSDMGCFEY